MWYILWVIGVLFACGVGGYFALRLERAEQSDPAEDKADV